MTVLAPALKAGFVVDDFQLLVDNLAITSPGGLSRIWASRTQADYFPLTLTSFWLE